MHTFWLVNIKEEGHFGDQVVDGHIIKMNRGEIGCEDMDWNQLAKNVTQWRN
jgi:hypothetical protein